VGTDSDVAKALSSEFNTASKAAAGSSKTLETMTTLRGYVMTVSALVGIVSFSGREESLAGLEQHGTSASTAERRCCAIVDGGVRPALETLLRRFFRCKLVARTLFPKVLATNLDLSQWLPEPLIIWIQDAVRAGPAEVGPAPNTAVTEIEAAEIGGPSAVA